VRAALIAFTFAAGRSKVSAHQIVYIILGGSNCILARNMKTTSHRRTFGFISFSGILSTVNACARCENHAENDKILRAHQTVMLS
jgi:hypothetical protein